MPLGDYSLSQITCRLKMFLNKYYGGIFVKGNGRKWKKNNGRHEQVHVSANLMVADLRQT